MYTLQFYIYIYLHTHTHTHPIVRSCPLVVYVIHYRMRLSIPQSPQNALFKMGILCSICDVLQECNLAVKQDLPIATSPPPPLAAAAAANNLRHTHTHTKHNVILCSKLYFVLLNLQAIGLIPI